MRESRLAARRVVIGDAIVDALFINPKTAEANLARVYRKPAIARRPELATALQALGRRSP